VPYDEQVGRAGREGEPELPVDLVVVAHDRRL
jgi:hypothetical protein